MKFDIEIGKEITLTDEVTICELLRAKIPGAVNGEVFEVAEKTLFTQAEKLFRLVIYQLRSVHRTRFFAIKTVDSLCDYRIYEENGWFLPGTRADIIATDNAFIFQEPPDPNNYRVADLLFSDSIRLLSSNNQEIEYVKKNRAVFGNVLDTPKKSGFHYPLFAQMVEYSTSGAADNPEILILESGGLDSKGNPVPEGGWINFWEGRNITEGDFAVI